MTPQVENKIKISVIMVDGGFRDNIYSAQYFSNQTLPNDQYEVIWVEYYNKPNSKLHSSTTLKIFALNKEGQYHSSYCFNKGIQIAKGEIIVIPDADLIVKPNFLEQVLEDHQESTKLVSYSYRYDEINAGSLQDHSWDELESKCILKNTTNYGGCLSVRKHWLLKINGYELHPVFGSGFHANGLDIYTRFKNLGLMIKWNRELKLYHPWHPSTLAAAPQYNLQKAFIKLRDNQLQYKAILGIDTKKNECDKKLLQKINELSPEQESNPTPKTHLNRGISRLYKPVRNFFSN